MSEQGKRPVLSEVVREVRAELERVFRSFGPNLARLNENDLELVALRLAAAAAAQFAPEDEQGFSSIGQAVADRNAWRDSCQAQYERAERAEAERDLERDRLAHCKSARWHLAEELAEAREQTAREIAEWLESYCKQNEEPPVEEIVDDLLAEFGKGKAST